MTRPSWKYIIKNTGLIQARKNLITPDFINKTVGVSNGKQLKPLLIQPSFIGHKFGEFISTKLYPKYKQPHNPL